MDIYIFACILAVISLWLHSYFPMNAYLVGLLGGISILILIYLLKPVPWRSFWLYLLNSLNWRHFLKKSFLEEVGKDLFIGGAMAVVFSLVLHKYPFLADPEDASMDFVMQMKGCTKEKCAFPNKKVVLLNIDDQTYESEEWGKKPPFVPRNKLKELIEAAVKDGASLVVVDIFLSEKTDGLKYPGDKLHHDDEELRTYLAEYDKTNCANKKCPPIILVRNSYRPETETGNFEVHNLPVLDARPSFLDEAVKSSPHIQWASPTYWVSTFDGKLRRFWLWQSFCKGGKQEFMPSVELLATSLLVGNDNLEKTVDPDFVGRTCSPDSPYYEPKPLSEQIVLSDNLKIDVGELSGGGINQRIMFTMSWPGKYFDQQRGRDFIIPGDIGIIRSALNYLEKHRTDDSLSKKAIKNSIVIIGEGHRDAGDIHETPLGKMPGMLVIANAIYSLYLNGGQIKSFSWLGKVMVEGAIIIIIALMMNGFLSLLVKWYWFRLMLITGIMWFLLIHLSSWLLITHSTWIDFSLPLVAIFFHHVVTKFHELGKEKEKADKKADKAAKEWQTCQVKMQVCEKNLDKCEQDKRQLLLDIEKSKVLR
jgi:CHASE2 domain-containing sensor protein